MPNKLYLVVGLGKTGHSIARYLKRRHINFVLFDTRSQVNDIDEFKIEFPGVEVYLEILPEKIYNQIEAVITSPGVDCNLESMQRLKSKGIPIYGDVECFAREVSSPVIAITGTNGKSTVTSLVGEMVRCFGIPVGVAGNIGTPVLDMLDNGQTYELWVLELSSFQLDLTQSLQLLGATILNISPDHLDRHGSFNNYIAAKQRIFMHSEYYIYNRNDKYTTPANIESIKSSKLVSYGLDNPKQVNDWGIRDLNGELYLAHGQENLMPINNARLKGTHNWLNILAASALAHIAGISYKAICSALQEFRSLPHRCEFIRSLDGVVWIDDSKGTNIGATIAAINGLGDTIKGKIVLIAGGQGKGADFADLRDIVAKYVKSIVVIGIDAKLIKTALEDIADFVESDTLENAIKVARTLASQGDIVLLSPACASLDMFRDYNHRGEVFAEVVNKLSLDLGI